MPQCQIDKIFLYNLFCLAFISILNKLTPEKFDKLCLELLNVGVDTKLVLKGIVLLVTGSFFCLFLTILVRFIFIELCLIVIFFSLPDC